VNRWVNPEYWYYLALGTVIFVTMLYRNLLRSPMGRAFAAVRDSEISAQAMGIDVARTKTIAFGLSCAFAGLGGALMGLFAGAFNNETFNFLIAIQLLMMIVIGGLGFIHGAFLGAIVVAFPAAGAVDRHRYVGNQHHSRTGDRCFRHDSDCLHHVRADGPLWPLAEDQVLAGAFSLRPAGHVPPPEKLSQDGAPEMSLLALQNVTLKFGGVTAVNDLSMSVEEGQVFALVGPNGAGKSTVFNMISRFYTPASGSITFDGRNLLKQKPHQVPELGIARTFQNIELFERATVLQNLLVGRHRHRKTMLIEEMLFFVARARARRARAPRSG
jgi:ABC-type multidrug transport system fused ATPase/permease subunit